MTMPKCSVLLAAALTLTSACSARNGDQVELRTPDTASRLHIAETAAAAGQNDIALSMYVAAAAANPNDVQVQARLADMLIRVGKPNVAAETLTRALAARPSDPTLLRWLGNLRLEQGFTEAALQIYDGLITRKPDDVAALNGKAVALDLLGRHQAAQQTYRLAQSIAPADLQTANNLAVSLLIDNQPLAAKNILAPFAQQPNLPERAINNFSIAQAAAGNTAAETSTTSTLNAGDLRILSTALNQAGNPGPVPIILSPNTIQLSKPAG